MYIAAMGKKQASKAKSSERCSSSAEKKLYTIFFISIPMIVLLASLLTAINFSR
jgi:hypothetical protein